MILLFSLLLVSMPIEVTIESSSSVDTLLVSLKNNTNDTLFLFDSYLNEKRHYMESRYLHRFNFSNKEFKLSFWPLVTYLSPDVESYGYFRFPWFIKPDDVIRYGKIGYHFNKMAPNESLFIRIPRKVFESNEFIQDFDVKELLYAFQMNGDIPFKCNHYYKTDARPGNDYTLEFAICNLQGCFMVQL